MDFTDRLKKDIIEKIPKDGEHKLPFLVAVTKICGVIELYKKSVTLTYEFKSKDDALAVLPIVREFCKEDVFFVQKGARGESVYRIEVKDNSADELLKTLHLSHYEEDNFVVDNGVKYLLSLNDDKLFYSYLKGLLLVTGKLRFPDEEYSNYSLQISFSDEEYCKAFSDKMAGYNIELKQSDTKTGQILQSRNSSDIADILAMCNANNCVLELNNILAQRENENEFNRMSNFYMANYNKMLAGVKKYTDAIKFLEEKGLIESLDAKLKKIAIARLENKEDSMKELADKLSMSKTSLSRALNKILEIAEGEYDGRE